MAERLQKWLASRGFGSRREIERWITAGRITVNGAPAILGQKVAGTESFAIDGRPLHLPATPARRSRILIYHKPTGEICTRSDPEGRPTVFERLPPLKGSRWISVGRLDVQTSGLLLFTEDGELANALMHPSAGLPRDYAVRIRGDVSAELLRLLQTGMRLDDGPASFDSVEFTGGAGTNRWYRVRVSEGRNRLVRRLWEAAGCQVTRLIRIRFGPIDLPRELARARFQSLAAGPTSQLYQAAGLPIPGDATLR